MGIKVADAFIAVSGDLSQYRKDLAGGAKDAQSLGQQVRAALTNPAGFGGQSKLAGFISDLRLGRSLTGSLREAATGLGGTLKGLGVQALHSGLNGVKTVLGGLKGAFGALFQGIGLGAGIASFQALGRAIGDIVGFIPNLIDKARDYALTVRTIQISTGATVEESSRFAATMDYLGGRTTKLANLFAQMSRNIDTAREQLNSLGVVTHGANGAVLSQIQILDNARQAFQRYGDGTAKADAIARAFGEEGLQTFNEYLRLSDEQLRIVAEDAERSGRIISKAQIDAALATERESNRIQNALTGIGVALLTTVGPQIANFLSNLTGWVQENTAAISKAVSEAVSFILGLVSALTGVGDGFSSFSASLLAGSKEVSPYSADLASLYSQLAKLDEGNEKASGGTDELRESIQKQIDVIEREIKVLDRQDKIQDGVFRRAIAGLARVYQARLDNLDLAERERENLERQRDLNDQLNDAQLALQEAQRGKAGVVDAEAVAAAMERITEIQREQANNARDLEVNQQRESLEATRDYIEEIGALLENADDKRAALNNLRTRQGVLEARRVAQEAAGDTEGAADTAARLEAIKTAELRAEEEIRQGVRRSNLERQKEMLAAEKAAVKATAVAETDIRREEIQKQIAHLQDLQEEWEKNLGKQTKNIHDLGWEVSGKGGLTDALNDARDAGVKFGEDVKAALQGLADALGGLLDLLRNIGDNEVFRFLNSTPEEAVKGIADAFVQGDIDYFRTLPPKAPFEVDTFGSYGGILKQGMTNEEAVAALVRAGLGRDQGGWIGKGVFANNGPREYVLDNALSEKLSRFFSVPQMPALAGAATSFSGSVTVPVYLDGREIARVVSKIQADERRF